MSSSSWLSNRLLALLAVTLVFLAICFRLGYLPLLAPDEGRNAEVGREMKDSGSWLVPTYNGLDYLDKPAFYFKLVGFALSFAGINETAARLPSAMFGVGLVVLVFAFGRKVHGTRCGLLAAMVAAATPLYLANARTVIFDIALAFFVCGAIFSGYLAEETEGPRRRNWYLLGAALAGLGTLVKGPIGVLIPVLVLLVYGAVEGKRGAWKRLLSPLNAIVFFAVTLPWFIGLCLAHRDFFQYGLVEETFHRFTSAKTFHRAEPFYFYLIIVAATFFPWSLLLPEAAWAAWKQRRSLHSADRLCLIWSLVVVVFFSISQSKLPGYILTATVSCALLVARLVDAALRSDGGLPARQLNRATAWFATACLLAAVAAWLSLSQMHVLAQPLHIPAEDGQQLGERAMPMILMLVALSVAGWLAFARRSVALCFLALAFFAPLGANLGVGMLKVVYDAKSGRRIANALETLPARTEVVCLECFPNGLPFYLKRPITLVSRDGHELTSNYIVYALSRAQDWPEQVVPLRDFDTWLASHTGPVYLIARPSDRDKLQAIAASRKASVQSLSPEYVGADLPAAGGS